MAAVIVPFSSKTYRNNSVISFMYKEYISSEVQTPTNHRKKTNKQTKKTLELGLTEG